MANEHHATNIEIVLSRGRVIFLVLFGLCIVSFTSALYIGLESGEIQQKISKTQKQWADFQKSLESLPTPTPIFIERYPTPTSEPTPTDIPPQKQQTNYYYYTYPTSKPYPTIVPGQLGSKEWEEEFQRKWNSYSSGSTSTYSFPTPKPGAPGSPEWKDNFDRKSQEMQQNFENMKKEICAKSPSLCK